MSFLSAVSPVAPTLPSSAPATVAPTTMSSTDSTSATSFAQTLADGLDKVAGLQSTADSLALQAATGRLENVHDYTIAATQAKLATELTVAIRNKAVEAFNEIMRMAG